MSYEIEYLPEALEDLEKHRKAGNKQLIKKISKLIDELRKHPYDGTGKPEQLKYYQDATWSRRIDDKHRMVYEIHNEKVVILILALWGHYKDK